MGIINQLFHGLVDSDYNYYPGFFKRQKHTTGLDMYFDYEYSSRVKDSIDKKYDLDHIVL
jgi:hypothetical protein